MGNLNSLSGVYLLSTLLKTRYPIIQAPMAGSDNPEFVAAACNAGILGSLGAQYRTPAEIRQAIAAIRALTDKPFAVNLFVLNLWSPSADYSISSNSSNSSDFSVSLALSDSSIDAARAQLGKYYAQFGITPPSNESVKKIIDPEAQLAVLLDEQVPVFSFTLGIPAKRWVEAFKAKSILLIGSATNVKEACALQEAGVDAICAQGTEAGGHRGTFIGKPENSLIGGLALLPQIVDAVGVPVIAAGGVMDGRALAAAMALGASGVQMGTAFLTTTECPVHENYKIAIQKHTADETAITSVFSGGAARGIENQYFLENATKEILPFPFQNALTKSFRKIANECGDVEMTNLWSGQAGRLARRVSTAVLVQEIIEEAEKVISEMKMLKFEE